MLKENPRSISTYPSQTSSILMSSNSQLTASAHRSAFTPKANIQPAIHKPIPILPKKSKQNNTLQKWTKDSMNCGAWSEEEHAKFLEAVELFGNNWHLVVDHIKTRTAAQVRSHGQKYYRKLRRRAIKKFKNEKTGPRKVFVVVKQYRVQSYWERVAETKKNTTVNKQSITSPKPTESSNMVSTEIAGLCNYLKSLKFPDVKSQS